MDRTDVLNVLGCGKAGRAVARLLHDSGSFAIGAVANRSLESAHGAVSFIGAGRAVEGLVDMPSAAAWLIATGDDAIGPAAEALAGSGLLRAGDVVFHLSGATASLALAPCARFGAAIASVHPVKNFSDPQASVDSFTGTFCGCEGDAQAMSRLKPAFERLGARLFDIDSQYKAIYHGGGAFACNFLPVLMEVALRCEQKAGIDRELALAMFEPIARETLDAVFRQGIAPALAGPISRGDAGTVARHLAAMAAWDRDVSRLYAQLGAVAVDIVESLGRVDGERIAATRAAIRSAMHTPAGDAAVSA